MSSIVLDLDAWERKKLQEIADFYGVPEVKVLKSALELYHNRMTSDKQAAKLHYGGQGHGYRGPGAARRTDSVS